MKKIVLLLWTIFVFSIGFSVNLSAESAHITIDGSQITGKVNPLIWGTNLIHDSDTGEGVWDSKLSMPNNGMVQITKNTGIRFLRFPGGCLAHKYNWRNAIGPKADRPKTTSIWGHSHTYQFGLEEFVEFCRQVGAEPIVTVSYFTGGPSDAADLVEYCNGSVNSNYGRLRKSHGYASPFNIKYWEIGNEVMHGTKEPHRDLPLDAVSPIQYAKQFKSFVSLMKKKDTGIQIGAVAVEIGLKALDSFGMYWNQNLVNHAQEYIDFMILHSYLPGYATRPSSDPVGHFKALMSAANQTEHGISQLQTIWRKSPGFKKNKRKLRLAFTEYHAGFLTEERFSWAGALHLADFMIMMLKPDHGVIGSNYMEHSNGYWGMFKGSNPIKLRPDGKIFNILAQHKGESILAVNIDSDTFNTPDIGFIYPQGSLKSETNRLEGPNLTADNGFENGNLAGDWIYKEFEGGKALVDKSIAHSGTYAARIDFDGTRDLNFFNVFQYVDVNPGQTYRLSGFIRTEKLNAEKGVSLALMDVKNYEDFNVYTQQLSGDNDWTWVEKVFKVPENVTKVFLMLRRFSGGGKISGTAWFDDIVLEKFEPYSEKQPRLVEAFANETIDQDIINCWVINRSPDQSIDLTLSLLNVNLKSSLCEIQTMTSGSSDQGLYTEKISTDQTQKEVNGNILNQLLKPASLTIMTFEKKELNDNILNQPSTPGPLTIETL